MVEHPEEVSVDNRARAKTGSSWMTSTIRHFRRSRTTGGRCGPTASYPLSFSYTTRKVMQLDGAAIGGVLHVVPGLPERQGTILHGQHQSGTSTSGRSRTRTWSGGEVHGPSGRSVVPAADARVRQAVDQSGSSTGRIRAEMRPRFWPISARRCSSATIPGFDGTYWRAPSAYDAGPAALQAVHAPDQEDRHGGLEAGQLCDAVRSRTIFVERFDSQTASTFYLTAQNTSTGTKYATK